MTGAGTRTRAVPPHAVLSRLTPAGFRKILPPACHSQDPTPLTFPLRKKTSGFSQPDKIHSFLITPDEQGGNFCYMLCILQHEIPGLSGYTTEMGQSPKTCPWLLSLKTFKRRRNGKCNLNHVPLKHQPVSPKMLPWNVTCSEQNTSPTIKYFISHPGKRELEGPRLLTPVDELTPADEKENSPPNHHQNHHNFPLFCGGKFL